MRKYFIVSLCFSHWPKRLGANFVYKKRNKFQKKVNKLLRTVCYSSDFETIYVKLKGSDIGAA